MKFKFMGMKMNTLYVILIILAILGGVYLILDINKSSKENFDLLPTTTSTNVVANLIGNDFYNLPTNQQVKAAVNQPYNKRFAKAIRYAVYALYKMSTGLILLAEKIGDAENTIQEQKQKGRDNIDGMSEADFQEMNRQITADCSTALTNTQTQVDIIINTLSGAERTLCGDELKGSIQMDMFVNAIEDLKVCKSTLSEKINEIPTANILADTADFTMIMVNEVLKYLELLKAELILLADCESIKNAVCGDGRGAREGMDDYVDEDESHHDEDHHSNSSRPSSYNNAYSNSLTSNTQSSNLPKGIPGYMIPPGQEDMYILKSEVVPPVCPACPDPVLKCNDNSKPPPPCPPCARCPEPAFDCKKVPNYGTGNLGANYNNFNTGFGRMMGPDGLAPPSLPYPASPENSMYGA